MDYQQRLAISYYKTIATINEEHKVFLAQHIETHKIYIKKILEVYNTNIYLFLKQNPILGIPKIIDLCEENGQLVLIEEYVSGVSLDELICSRQLSADFIPYIMLELCDILNRLHSVTPPIIHRDIKPSNIIVTSYNHIVLLDFNAAKYLTNVSQEDTVLLGTKGYAAPEQYGFGSSMPQTDIYALGVLLKELNDAANSSAYYYEKIIKKCTQIDPNDRYASVRDLQDALIKCCRITAGKKVVPSKRRFLPPGFRTLTPWKMFVSLIVYTFIFWLCCSFEVKDTFGAALWFERIFCLIIMLSVIACSFNYCNIQKGLPLCNSKNRFVHYLGILLWDFVITIGMFVMLVFIITLPFFR